MQSNSFKNKDLWVFTLVGFLYRYFAIVHPLKQMTHNKKITVTISLIVIWSCALSQLIVRNTVAVFKTKHALLNETSGGISTAYSRLDDNKHKYYFIAIFPLYNVFPFVVVFYLYTQIIMKLRSRGKELRETNATVSQRNESVTKNQRKTIIMLVIVPVVIVVCGWPYTILHLILAYMPEVSEMQSTNTVKLADSLLRILAFIPSTINPIIYNFFSEKFRAGFRQLFSK